MLKKKAKEIDYTSRFKIGEFYKLDTGTTDRDKLFGVYYCIGKDDKGIYFDGCMGYFKFGEFIVSNQFYKDGWPKHMDMLDKMELVAEENYPEVFTKIMRGIFRGDEDV